MVDWSSRLPLAAAGTLDLPTEVGTSDHPTSIQLCYALSTEALPLLLCGQFSRGLDWTTHAVGQQHTSPLRARCEARRREVAVTCGCGSGLARDAPDASNADGGLRAGSPQGLLQTVGPCLSAPIAQSPAERPTNTHYLLHAASIPRLVASYCILEREAS